MELAKIEVSRADARKVHCDTLTAGMKGAKVSFSFDASWDGLKRIAIFKAGGVSKDMLLTEDHCQIPHEVLAKPCPRLVVGIVGTTADGCLVIPTVWAELGRVEQGAKPSGDGSTKPTPEVWAQILGMIGDLNELNTEEKETLVAAINEVLLKGADPEEVERIVSEYLAENGSGGIHIGPYPPDDPNVDIWLDTSEEETSPYIPNTTAKPGQIVRVVAVDGNGAITAVEAVDIPDGGHELSAATADALGGIKAEPVTDDDTQPVRIGEDGMLYTAPGSGGGEVWETIIDYTVPEDCAQVLLTTDINGNPFSLKRAIAVCLVYPLAEPAAWPLRCVFDSQCTAVYGSQHFWNGLPTSPNTVGKYAGFKLEVCKTNDGISVVNGESIATAVITEDGTYTMNPSSVYQRYYNGSLSPVATGITAFGVGSYKTAVGAGTRIKLLGVRE